MEDTRIYRNIFIWYDKYVGRLPWRELPKLRCHQDVIDPHLQHGCEYDQIVDGGQSCAAGSWANPPIDFRGFLC